MYSRIVKINFIIPDKNVNLIYKGYDYTHFFVLKQNEVIKMYTLYEKKIIKTNFLGYPLIENFQINYFSNKNTISLILKRHWLQLKNGIKKCHGDFTPFNILIKKNKFYFIDEKKNTQPIIFDHFYFYSSILFKVSSFATNAPEINKTIKIELDAIYLEIFKNENIHSLKNQLLQIKTHEMGNPNLFYQYKNIFIAVLEKI
jgi:hypothetical protein